MGDAAPFAIEIGDLVARLAERALELARDLLPSGVRHGSEWCVPAAGSPLECSISVHLTGSKAGVWGAWAADRGGDALDLIALAKCQGDKAAAIRWGLEWLRIDPSERNQAAALRGAKDARAKVSNEPSAAQKRDLAWRLWLNSMPLRDGDTAWEYLARRGIELRRMRRAPGALRYCPSLMNIEAGRRFPALVAAVFKRGQFLTVHRTWLECQENGQVRKAPVADPKKIFGPFKGGLIPLSRGQSGRPWKDPGPDDVVGLAEGIENALSYALEVPEHRVAAAVTVGNLAALDLHPALRQVILAADNDAPGSPAEQAMQRAATRFVAEGREVRIARCPPGVKDLNDLLRAGEDA